MITIKRVCGSVEVVKPGDLPTQAAEVKEVKTVTQVAETKKKGRKKKDV